MDREELPDYKKTFLNEMDELRRQQELAEQEKFNCTGMSTAQRIEKQAPNNNIINTSQYSSSDWRNQLNKTSSRENHDETHFNLNLLMNPEVGKKQNNIRSTQISQYSNARHNNTVFVNPKNTSC